MKFGFSWPNESDNFCIFFPGHNTDKGYQLETSMVHRDTVYKNRYSLLHNLEDIALRYTSTLASA